ncbi:MAG: ATPase, partial [Bacteroidales bacterium]|nr:ATPase [Bacteroidales bacterium]
VLPIEVKSGTSISGKSIKVFGEKYSSPLMIRFSGLNLRLDNNFLNIPLWLVDYAPRFLGMIDGLR